ncbi:secretion protein HlyD [Gemmatimonadetes bacterium T265]|nr:secretion protein HlyD [Gemmatimonadetes bacterium T265]
MSTATRPEPAPAPPAAPAPAPAPPPAAPAPAGNRRRIVLPIIAVLLLLGGGWGFKTWNYARAHETTDNAQVDGHIVPVLAKVGGYVQRVTVDENQPVKEDQLLVQIDSADYAVRVTQAQADLQASQAGVGGRGSSEALVQTAESQTAAGQANVAAARATLAKAQADFTRYQQLAAEQIISQQQLDGARAAVDVAAAQVTAAQRQAAAAGSGIGNAQAGVRLADARLASSRAALDNAKLQLSYTHITAPVSGVVSKKTVEVGQLVQPGQTLMSVVADTGTWVTANFKETQLDDIRIGQPVDLDVDAYDGATAKGVVESISAASGAKFALLPPDNATGNFTKVVQRVPVRVRITQGLGANRPLRPGMSVYARVATKEGAAPNAAAAPGAAPAANGGAR